VTGAGIHALAVSFPATIRTGEYFRAHHPEALADAEQKSLARLFSAKNDAPPEDPFDIEMAPYLSDPFRGTVERHVLAPGESSLALELDAARQVLRAARLAPSDVDAIMVASFVPDTMAAGNATWLARALDVTVPAWNLESACASTIVGIQNAAALIRAGEYERVLLVVSCTYSRLLDANDSLSWFMGDGAGALVIGRTPASEGVLATKVISTQETCGAFDVAPIVDGSGRAVLRMQPGDPNAGRVMRDRAADQLRTCVDGALARAGVKLDDVAFFVFNTPVAWFARACARTLGVDPERTISVYPSYGNIGAALTTANLYHAARAGKIRRGDLVLVYAVGSTSTAGATLMRWGDVGLGEMAISSRP
jgi:3-oxoacyl-[acyl-carrier-protein] synthase-3